MTEREKLLATSEITLREAIDKLVAKAKDEGSVTDESDGSTWTLSGPAPTSVVADPALVPKDLPPGGLSLLVNENKLVVKVPPQTRLTRKTRGKRETLRWDYVGPAAAPEPAAPPLFSEVGLRSPEKPTTTPKPAPTAPTSTGPATPAAPAWKEVAPSPAPAASPTTEPASADPEIVPSAEAPETIRISKPGEYEIDVKRLMEANPIVIQRDGTYLIHLASLFEAGKPKRQ